MIDRSIADLDGKTAIVTGGGRGIGKGLALGLAAFGANVVVAERNHDLAEESAAEIAAMGGKSLAAPTDVREFDQVKAAVDKAVETFGGVDVLVNNVGGGFPADFLHMSERGWDAILRINLKATFYCTKAVSEQMIEQGRGGSIISVASIEGLRAAPGWAVYGACKAGIINFTQTMALELSKHRIRVSCISPGHIITPGIPFEHALGDDNPYERSLPLQRLGTIEDMAGVAAFLASDMSEWVTGINIPVDGGAMAARGWVRDHEGVWLTSL